MEQDELNAISHATITLRKAVVADAAERAVLDDMAGNGLPSWLWQRSANTKAGDTALAFGRRMMMEEMPPWGWRNSVIAQAGGRIAGMVTSYRMPVDTGEPGENEPVLKPIFELMSQAAGQWYVDALAVYEEWRGRGVGAALLSNVMEQAAGNKCESICLIVSSDNVPARGLYERNGFRQEVERGYIARSGQPVAGKYHLFMRRKLK